MRFRKVQKIKDDSNKLENNTELRLESFNHYCALKFHTFNLRSYIYIYIYRLFRVHNFNIYINMWFLKIFLNIISKKNVYLTFIYLKI